MEKGELLDCFTFSLSSCRLDALRWMSCYAPSKYAVKVPAICLSEFMPPKDGGHNPEGT